MRTVYEISGPDVVHENFGGDLVVLNLASGQYFGLNSSGAALWEAIVAGRAPADLGATPEAAQAAVAFAEDLMGFGLITARGEATTEAGEPIALGAKPSIEAYDDLSDLIVADPIHDVDAEVGWPKMPEGAQQP